MTEDEAKAQPCIGPAPHNTGEMADSVHGKVYTCRGSACLAWRDLYETANVREICDDASAGTVAKLVKAGGYCAWAGRP